MKVDNIGPTDLSVSVIAVPPIARHEDLSINFDENKKLIKHIEQGGISTLMYGGNANFYNLPLSEYADTLTFLAESVSEDTWLIPAAGPDYGRLVDQVQILRETSFPTVMILPQTTAVTPEGAATAIRRFAEQLGRPVIIYIKKSRYLSPKNIGCLANDGIICGIKYAVVREDPAGDDYLRQLLENVERSTIVSGMGERPALVHMRDYGLCGFTTGCGVIAPRASNALLNALKVEDFVLAEEIRNAFLPLEDWRDRVHPIRILHEAVSLSGIANMGPILPLLHNLEQENWPEVKAAATELLKYEGALASENAGL